ncbi:unnamed protein product [Microthlaspi erraticum]|uniref:Uncharacterized protein n=1 Tax=Microthlaspi erraticum TaxID=1685480 RepID=A0A6D2KF21_9BRAS|nr:unnamed protein product [Microthlaspi erraticum]
MKHAGDLTAAAALADEARRMDLADRYINRECVKRMLQADQLNNLNDTQCMWYDLASGDSLLGRALKKFFSCGEALF